MKGIRGVAVLAGVWIFLSTLAISALALGGTRSAEAAGGYRPVVFSYSWGESEGRGVCLLGGFKDGKWYRHEDLPVMADGRVITPEEGMELSEPVSCTTSLLERGEKLAFYASNGQKLGVAAVKDMKYSCSAASGESFIDVETEGLNVPAHTLAVGVGEGWDAVPVPTEYRADKERVVFSSGSLSITFVPAVDEYGEKVYRGAVAYGDKSWPLTDAYADDQEQLVGMFADLNGDGKMEFCLYSQSIAGFVLAFALGDDGPVEILSLDLGD